MRRALGVLVAVLVLGAWTCAPVDDGGAEVSMTTTGWAGLAAGEPWRYVGDTDQPAFENGWDNNFGGTKTAFRIRESGIVDIHGQPQGGTPGSTIFTLPAGYRPTFATNVPVVGLIGTTTSAGLVIVSDSGAVYGLKSPTNHDLIFLSTQVFLNTPEITP